jgi:hypothetical protein
MRKSVLSVGFLFVVLVILSFSTRNVSAPTSESPILIVTSDGYMSGTDHQATFLITVVMVNNDPSGHHVFLTLETPVLPSGSVWDSPPVIANALPPGWTYSFSPSELDMSHGQSVLTITGTAGTPPGLKPFKVTGYWIAYVIDNPMHDVYKSANNNSFVTVEVKLMVPEYLLGTILGLAGMFAAFGTYCFSRRKQSSL